jgi:tryptophan synthase beta chain
MVYPDARGYFGRYGGRFVPETIMSCLDELTREYAKAQNDQTFQETVASCLREYVGRPSPLYYAERLTRMCGGAQIFMKREDLMHTGAHKINNTVGQILLAQRMGKKRIIAETGAGQHGVATATVCAKLGIECCVYMGEEDARRQRMNLFRMELLGAEVIRVNSGSCTLKDAINAAIRDWVTNVETTHYCIGSVVGPHPYPMIVRDFQSVIGRETRDQILKVVHRMPDVLVACVGGGSNAIGFFYPFLGQNIRMIGVEGGGLGLDTGRHAATLCQGRIGVLHGTMTYLLQDADGQVLPTHSISAGLDYPGVGPEHSFLKDECVVAYTSVIDTEALDAFRTTCHVEGILPALESAHALAYVLATAPKMERDSIIIVNVSGRGDKDLDIVEGLV